MTTAKSSPCALSGLEGRLPGKPGRGVRRLARAVCRVARPAALQPAPRSVREGAAQLEHLQRLVPRPCLRDRADHRDGRQVPHDHEGLSAQPDGGFVQPGEDAEADRSDVDRQVTPTCERSTQHGPHPSQSRVRPCRTRSIWARLRVSRIKHRKRRNHENHRADKTSSPPRSFARWLSPQPLLAPPTRCPRGTTARPSNPSSTSSRR